MILRAALLGVFLSLNLAVFQQPTEREAVDTDRFVAVPSAQPKPIEAVSYGRALFRRDSSTAIEKCRGLRGCDTGVLIEAAQRLKVTQLDLRESARRLEEDYCAKEPEYMLCWYNLGHSFYELSSRNIVEAGALCRQLQNKEEPVFNHCVGGVFRRWFHVENGTRALCHKYPEYIHPCTIAVMAGQDSLSHVD